MRFIAFFTAGVVMLSVAFADQAGPPELPDAMITMIQELDSSESPQVTIRSEIRGKASWTTEASAASDNQLSIVLSVSMQDIPDAMQTEFVSDGTSLLTSTSEREPRVTTAHPQLRDRFLNSLGRTGFLYTFLTPVADGNDNESLSDLMTLGNCFVAGDEQGDDKSVVVVQSEFQVRGTGQSVPCRVWIDTQSHLPTKRTFQLEGMEVEETYECWKINESIEAATF